MLISFMKGPDWRHAFPARFRRYFGCLPHENFKNVFFIPILPNNIKKMENEIFFKHFSNFYKILRFF